MPMPTLAVAVADEARVRSRTVLNVAHRGASGSAPENTLASVELAAAQDADLVELDVRVSRDGVPMLLHDETLARTTDAQKVFPRRAPWRVGDFDHAELMRLDAGSWFSPAFAGERLLTLDTAMEAARRCGLGVLVELKSPGWCAGPQAEVASVLRRQLAVGGGLPIVVQSFDHVAMEQVKAGLPSVPVGLLGAPPASELPRLSEWADQVNPHHLRATASYVEAVHQRSMRCLVWTVNRRRSMRRVLSLGVDGVITNRPAVLRDVLNGSDSE